MKLEGKFEGRSRLWPQEVDEILTEWWEWMVEHDPSLAGYDARLAKFIAYVLASDPDVDIIVWHELVLPDDPLACLDVPEPRAVEPPRPPWAEHGKIRHVRRNRWIDRGKLSGIWKQTRRSDRRAIRAAVGQRALR